PCLLEVNGRFWGTMDLSVAAGMDFPVLACRMARDGDIPEQMDYRAGLRYRWPFPYAILRWLGATRDFLLPRRATRSDLSLSDPMPLIMEFAYTARRVWRRRGKAVDPVEEWRKTKRKDGTED
ncbi:MAG: ATP-grasp domain-containing protein, partial [Lysobacterales bacterium]